MRACVFALAVTAIAQPAIARDYSHRHSRQIAHHHHHHHHHGVAWHQRAGSYAARIPGGPSIESGYSMPQSFARIDATDSIYRHQVWQPIAPQPAPFAAGPSAHAAGARNSTFNAMIARHAAANGLPAELVHRVVIRESRYNPRARNRGALGLMQIKYATARSMGYASSASGLLDAETNLTYAVRYLAGAYRAAGGNANRAVAFYASGYRGRGTVARAPQTMVADSSSPVAMQAAPVAMRATNTIMTRYPRWRHSAPSW